MRQLFILSALFITAAWLCQGKESLAEKERKQHKLYVAIDRYSRPAVSKEGSLLLWDLERNELKETLTLKGNARYERIVAFRPDQRVLAVARDGEIILWDVSLGKIVRTFKIASRVSFLMFHPDGQRLAFAGKDDQDDSGSIKILNVKEGKVVQEFKAHSRVIKSLSFHPDGKRLVSAGRDADLSWSLRLWDIESGNELWTLKHPREINCVTFSPDGKYMAFSGRAVLLKDGSLKGGIQLWDISSGEPRLLWQEGNELQGYLAAFTHDGKKLVVDGVPRLYLDATRVFDVKSGKEIRRIDNSRRQGKLYYILNPTGDFLRATVLDQEKISHIHVLK